MVGVGKECFHHYPDKCYRAGKLKYLLIWVFVVVDIVLNFIVVCSEVVLFLTAITQSCAM